ncbi:Hpt domain-containing protein [uncultured Methylophaga sp.]|uniref:hybrid sensor histidine kinase/response regulator n=1 Tax=uncultured Methylophaga sp. TaxID=285271 RepID=UPI002618009A|nr:Hpt domain-containing protein [uncultured Methylophaga sp.]
MAQFIKGNYNALMWLQEELQQSLAHALYAMNSYIDGDTDSAKSLSDCIGALYQVKGTLDMVNMSGAAMLADEMQQTAIALRDHRTADKEQAQDALVRALLLLPNYLKLLSNDFQDHPLSLLDSFNELRHTRGAEKLTEQALFNPILSVALPDSIAPNPLRKPPAIAIERNKLGHAFQVMLLNWLRQQDQESLRKMRGVTHYLRLASLEEKTTLLWWAAETMLEALEQDGLETSAECKQLLGKLVAPIKTQSEQSEAVLLETLPTELIHKLLLQVARAQSSGPLVTLLKATFNLHFLDHKQKIYGMSDNALGDAHLALLEQLEDLKSRLDRYNPDQDLDAATISEITQQLQSMTDTLALLTEYEASNLLQLQAEKLQALNEDNQRPDEDALTELADVLLQVEKFLQTSTQASVNDQLRHTVMSECLLEMANIKETLTLMSQAQRHPDQLGETERQLGLIAGSMEMLNYPDCADILRQTVSKISEHNDSHEAFSPAQLNYLADILACCDIYMEGISQHGHAEPGFLADARDKLAYYDQADEYADDSEQTPSESGETVQDPALAELDSLLNGDNEQLLFDAEPANLSIDEQATKAGNHSAETALSSPESAGSVADIIANRDQWQFAEGIDAEIADVFIEEAQEVLGELDSLMPQWLNHNNEAALTDIRRHFHTLKGSGRMAGATVLAELAWGVEKVLNHVLDGTRPETEQVQQLTAESHQLIPELLARFTRADNSSTARVDALHELKQACLSASADDSAAADLTLSFAETDDADISETASPEADNAASVLEFDPADYQPASDNSTSQTFEASDFTVETALLTGVERYLRRQQNTAVLSQTDEQPAALTGVEQYIRSQREAAPVTDTAAPSLTGVERYLRQQADETSVSRYIRQQSSIAEPEADLIASPAVPHQALTSVDRYLIEQARQQRPLTGVARYLAEHDAHTEADDVAAEEDDELLQIFASEASQHIEQLKQGLDDIAFSRQLNKAMLRAIHSLKGCANIAGITPMGLIATDLDTAMKQLYASDSVLDNTQMQQLNLCVGGLEQILASVTGDVNEPDMLALSAAVSSLQSEIDSDSGTVVIDPEFLVVFLEETDELLDRYTNQLNLWRQQPGDNDNLQALTHTLYDLEQAASQAQQQQIARVYAALSRLIQQRQPDTPGLESLLEQGYEQLNQHIENLLQNKPHTAEFDFADRVDNYLASQTAPPVQHEPVAAIDETEFALPADADPELLEAFSEEAAELLTSSGQSIKAWQQDTDNSKEPLQLQRDLHTLKGGARLTGITPMADLTHQLETLVLAVCDQQQAADEDFFDLMQRCQDKLSEMQEQLADNQSIQTALSLIEEIAQRTNGQDLDIDNRPLPEPEITQPSVTETLAKAVASETAAVKPSPHVEQVRVRAELLDYLTNFAGEVSIARDRVTQQHTALRQQLQEMEETVSRLHGQLRKLEIETETQILFRYEDERLKQDSDFDPLELDRFSMIQQLSRGLTESVIDLNDISQSMNTLVKETDTILLQQSRINTDLQEGLMATRLLPFSGVTPRLERIVRQTATELEKKASLSIQGAELELDRTILDRLVPPLEHLLRNAIAHGIEAPGERLANGKNEQGQLQLQIERQGSEMVLTLSDDGRGIDIDKVKQKALSLNLVSADNMPGEEELIQLILSSGFSTADNISQLSGRGVGMDVVSNEIRSLKGRLSIHSDAGQGTHFTIRLPLTLSVVQSLLVRVQEEQYAVPLGSINAGERISVRDIKLLLGTHNPHYVFNGEKYDFMPLASLMGKPLTLPDNLKQQLPLLLFRSGEMRVALLVDDIISNREIVIKSVGRQLGTITAINGATILGDGRVVFILDIPTLIETSRDIRFDSPDAAQLDVDLNQVREKSATAMVVDDSITMRKASGNLLKRLGFEVMTARDGVDALSQLHEQKPDIILLDVEMPRMDGFEFASIVRNDDNFQHLPIIMITSRTGQKHRERALEIGVNAYLGKPYQEQELVSEMQKLLGQQAFPVQPA